MSGPELAEAARALRPDIRVVFTSGVVEGSQVPSHASFVPKPLRLEAIERAISEAFAVGA
jgi:two-component SAPR family response regulator